MPNVPAAQVAREPQVDPVKPVAHTQLYVDSPLIQVPPLKQGLGEQKFGGGAAVITMSAEDATAFVSLDVATVRPAFATVAAAGFVARNVNVAATPADKEAPVPSVTTTVSRAPAVTLPVSEPVTPVPAVMVTAPAVKEYPVSLTVIVSVAASAVVGVNTTVIVVAEAATRGAAEMGTAVTAVAGGASEHPPKAPL